MISRAFQRAAVAGAMAAFLIAPPARADIVFDFSGTCVTGCSGTATGALTLADSYTIGAEVGASDFISFDYSSSHLNFDITSANLSFITGGLNADGSFNPTGELVIEAASLLFEVAPESFVAQGTRDEFDSGNSFTFTLASGAVPEPSVWAMMLIGFAGLGYAGYRNAPNRHQGLKRWMASTRAGALVGG